MKKIVTFSTNQRVIDTVQKSCELYSAFFNSEIFGSTESAVSYINYEMPEIKVLDYTSKNIDCAKILETINSDAWLHYGGIIAVARDAEQVQQLEELKDNNMLTVQKLDDFERHFSRILRILYQNQQFLYTRGMQDIIGGQESGLFLCNNDPMDIRFYTNFLVSYLYNTNRISDDDRYALHITFMEMLTNALEHGNLNITYQEKTDWLMKGRDMLELISERRVDPRYCDRKIHISYAIGKTVSAFRIKDEGEGFDWRAIMNKKNNFDTHGRGISLSKQCVKKLTYNERGNQVTFTIANKVNAVNTIPGIMKPFDTIEYKNKEVVCRENEMSNDLFFIVSGRFAVYVKKKLVNVLTPNDMFIGEMAFLLNDRRTATVVSVGSCRVIKVPKSAFLSLIRKNPHYGIFLSKVLAQRLVNQTSATIKAKNLGKSAVRTSAKSSAALRTASKLSSRGGAKAVRQAKSPVRPAASRPTASRPAASRLAAARPVQRKVSR